MCLLAVNGDPEEVGCGQHGTGRVAELSKLHGGHRVETEHGAGTWVVERPVVVECAIEVVVKESIVKKILPELKRVGAQDIIEYPLNKLIA